MDYSRLATRTQPIVCVVCQDEVVRYQRLANPFATGYIKNMTTVKEIESALKELPDERLLEFREWYEAFDAERWDHQFQQDVEAGKLDALADEAIADFDVNRCREL